MIERRMQKDEKPANPLETPSDRLNQNAEQPSANGLRVLIATGGTAGHVVPALAVADALRARGAEVVFVGGDRIETELVPAAGIKLRQIDIEGISRRNLLKAVRALFKAFRSLFSALRILRDEEPDVVLGCGGYVAGPVGLAALLRRVPLVLTEADSHLGLTNRLLAPFAKRVCLSFAIEGRESTRYRRTGRPVSKQRTDREEARRSFGIGSKERCVLIFGGSLGARSLNQAAIKAFADTDLRVLHVTGEKEFSSLQPPNDRYILRPYIDPFGDALLASDLVIARAGGSIFEVAQYGRPSILVPYPFATADHQSANARQLADAGAAIVIPNDRLDPAELRTQVDALMSDSAKLTEMGNAAARWARPNAASDVADEVQQASKSSK
jgi:UDP-N-acetylglucosamine--N-acetylmuramyl-(pentapeptide) pyrophosphoryl-undecaprenol N-acetylglucosamine transferase